MTRTETAALLAVFTATFPAHPVPDPSALLTAWQMALGDVRAEAAMAAATGYLRTGRFFPAPAEIRRLVAEAAVGLPEAGDAWRIVMERMRSTYPGHPAPAWGAPEPVQRAVEACGGMYALRTSERPGADQARFGGIYETYRETAIRGADLAALPGGDAAAVGAGGDGARGVGA